MKQTYFKAHKAVDVERIKTDTHIYLTNFSYFNKSTKMNDMRTHFATIGFNANIPTVIVEALVSDFSTPPLALFLVAQ